MPLLTVTRGRDRFGLFRGPGIWLYGQRITGRTGLRPGRQITATVTAGSCILSARDWWVEQDLALNVTADDLEVHLAYPFRAIIRTFTDPSSAITLTLKNSKP